MKKTEIKTAKTITRAALFIAIALAIHVLEAQVPVPVAGIKLGLANVVTLVALLECGIPFAACVHFLRIFLGCVFGGGVNAMIYAFAGGTLSFVVTSVIYKRFGRRLSFVTGALGAVTHNCAQIAAAILISNTVQLLYYLPVLVAAAIISGSLTGFLAGKIRIPNTIK